MTAGHDGERMLVVHIDDVGMCHGANQAFLELFGAGFATTGSVMVPCPWFLEIAEAGAGDPRLDIGVHLTLTAEKVHYKWRPLTTPGPSAGLTDSNGFFWRDVRSVRTHCAPEAAEAEMRAQVDRALAAGIDVTHLDAHMGAVLAPEFIDAYIRLGEDYRVPVLLTELLDDYSAKNHLGGVAEETYQEAVARARETGFFFFDRVLETDWSRSGPARETYEPMFEAIPSGATFLALHANAPGELEIIEPGSAHIRTGEYDLFSDTAFREWFTGQGFTTSGFGDLRSGLRSKLP